MACQSTPTATLEGTSVISSNIVSTSVSTELRVVSGAPVVISTCVPTTVGNSSTCVPSVITSPGGSGCKCCIYHLPPLHTSEYGPSTFRANPPSMGGRLLSSELAERRTAVQGYQPLAPNARTSPYLGRFLSRDSCIQKLFISFISPPQLASVLPTERLTNFQRRARFSSPTS